MNSNEATNRMPLTETAPVWLFFIYTFAVIPLGRSLAANETLPVNPLRGVIFKVLVPLAPCATIKLLEAADKANCGTKPIAYSACTCEGVSAEL